MAGEPPARAKRFLRPLSLFFFYAYTLTVVAAGAWGIFGARVDFPVLLHQHVSGLEAKGAVNVLSQYRFLRGLELGFGIFAIWFRREVFTGPPHVFNHLFLTAMGLGILGRVTGLFVDGTPSPLMLSFLVFEAVGIVLIFTDTHWVARH